METSELTLNNKCDLTELNSSEDNTPLLEDNTPLLEDNTPLLEDNTPLLASFIQNSDSNAASSENVGSQSLHSSREIRRIDASESDSETEHFEDAVDALDLGSLRDEDRKAENECEVAYDEPLTDNCSDETGDDSGDYVIDENVIREQEAKLTEEEKQERRQEARRLKDLGNERFKDSCYKEAIECYSDALMSCLLCQKEDRAIIYSNRAAAYMKLEKYEDAIKDSSKALEYNPDYMKALLRRAELYERVDKLDEALEDYKKAFDRDPSLHQARAACMRLPEQINERNEKLKTEMMGKLKDLGNLILRPFGLSTDNFQLQQDPSTGSYSVNFQQSQQ